MCNIQELRKPIREGQQKVYLTLAQSDPLQLHECFMKHWLHWAAYQKHRLSGPTQTHESEFAF